MPIRLKNRDVIPSSDYDEVEVLNLKIPLTRDLPFGAQVELLDLQQRHEAGEFGQFEFLMRIFCVFTRRLAKNEHVRYDWLARQSLEAEEVAELTNGTMALLNALQEQAEGDGGNAPKPKRAKKAN